MIFEKLISGGQCGADRGALDAALSIAFSTGGWCPKGRRAEDGAIPKRYPLLETSSSEYPQRTKWNVLEADATIIFTWGIPLSRGCALTDRLAKEAGKPCGLLDIKEMSEEEAAEIVIGFIQHVQPLVLNVAGSRESKAPGIQAKVERIMLRVFGHDWDKDENRGKEFRLLK